MGARAECFSSGRVSTARAFTTDRLCRIIAHRRVITRRARRQAASAVAPIQAAAAEPAVAAWAGEGKNINRAVRPPLAGEYWGD